MASKVEAICVDPKEIRKIWPHVEFLLWAAYARQDCHDNFETLLPKLKVGLALLWIAWDDEILGAAVTELWDKPKGKVCAILACGGKQMKRWIDCLAAIEKFARDEGCYLIHFEGRKGWQRVLPDYSTRVILEKKL